MNPFKRLIQCFTTPAPIPIDFVWFGEALPADKEGIELEPTSHYVLSGHCLLHIEDLFIEEKVKNQNLTRDFRCEKDARERWTEIANDRLAMLDEARDEVTILTNRVIERDKQLDDLHDLSNENISRLNDKLKQAKEEIVLGDLLLTKLTKHDAETINDFKKMLRTFFEDRGEAITASAMVDIITLKSTRKTVKKKRSGVVPSSTTSEGAPTPAAPTKEV